MAILISGEPNRNRSVNVVPDPCFTYRDGKCRYNRNCSCIVRIFRKFTSRKAPRWKCSEKYFIPCVIFIYLTYSMALRLVSRIVTSGRKKIREKAKKTSNRRNRTNHKYFESHGREDLQSRNLHDANIIYSCEGIRW